MTTSRPSQVNVSESAPTQAKARSQKRMGPAPFASFEDLSDELESPEDKHTFGSVVRLPGIREDSTPCSPSITTRITGISLVGATTSDASVNLSPASPAVREKQAITSLCAPPTPRIDISCASSSGSYHDSKEGSPDRDQCRRSSNLQQGVSAAADKVAAGDLYLSKEDLNSDVMYNTKQPHPHSTSFARNQVRPHSPSCWVEECSPSTMRKDSQSSDVGLLYISGRTSRISSIGSQGSAHSRISTTSHLSVMSGQSCLLSRSPSPHKMLLETSFCGTKPNDLVQKAEQQYGTKAIEPEELEKLILKRQHDPTQAILAVDLPITAKVEKPVTVSVTVHEESIDARVEGGGSKKCTLPKTILAPSGTQYTYIPLKGPMPESDILDEAASKSVAKSKNKARDKLQSTRSSHAQILTSRTDQQPKYIRIKLKPDHMYSNNGNHNVSETASELLSLDVISSVASPAQNNVVPRDIFSTDAAIQAPYSKSPTLSQKSSVSLFKTRDKCSTEPRRRMSMTEANQYGARSHGRERSKSAMRPSAANVDSKSHSRSILNIFKSGKSKKAALVDHSNLETLASELKISKTHTPKKHALAESETIRIPLHSPTYYEDKSILQDTKTSSMESQETVVEANVKIVTMPSLDSANLQRGYSSENMEFCTTLGSNEDMFKVILPKESQMYCKSEEVAAEIEDTTRIESVMQFVQSATDINRSPTQIINQVNENTDIGSEFKDTNNEIMQIVDGAMKLPDIIKQDVSQLVKIEVDVSQHSSGSEKELGDKNPLESEEIKHTEVQVVEPERKVLMAPDDSFDDEFPYTPTTLPQERSVAIPIMPIKERSVVEMKTCSIERPRSTTPINSNALEEYREDSPAGSSKDRSLEKLRICLPRDGSNSSLPKRHYRMNVRPAQIDEPSTSTTDRQPIDTRLCELDHPSDSKFSQSKEWINFEEIPERPKPPRCIQTIPNRGYIEPAEAPVYKSAPINPDKEINYMYANPEDCQCECHEKNYKRVMRQHRSRTAGGTTIVQQAQHIDHSNCGVNLVEHPQDQLLSEEELPLIESDTQN